MSRLSKSRIMGTVEAKAQYALVGLRRTVPSVRATFVVLLVNFAQPRRRNGSKLALGAERATHEYHLRPSSVLSTPRQPQRCRKQQYRPIGNRGGSAPAGSPAGYGSRGSNPKSFLH